MSVQFSPKNRTLVLCDYARGGFIAPEMVKRRPAVVVCADLPRRSGLCAVVPLSGSEPNAELPYVVKLVLDRELPAPFPQRVWWAKCDMVATVSMDRLDLFRTERDQYGKRKYLHPRISEVDFERIKQGILNGLGFVNLTFKS